MRLTVKELIARAYEVARALKDADAALLREVATRLDVTYVALSESMERNQHIAALTAENSELKSFILKECFVGHIEPETFYQEEVTRYVSADGYEPQTPVTDRFIAEQQPLAQVPEEKCDEDGITTSEFDQGWNACRSAMLSNEPVSNRDELPCTQFKAVADLYEMLFSDGHTMAFHTDPEKAAQWLRTCDGNKVREYVTLERFQQVMGGNSPVIPDGYCIMPLKLTADNGGKAALSGEFSETKYISCSECFGNEECESCDGSGMIKIEVPVSWTTIKAIWAKGVEHFSAAAQPEVPSE